MRIRNWRLLVVLALVAASLLLAVPGVAGAHVKAKYKAEYRSKLTSLNKGFQAFASNYDNMKQASVDAAQDLATTTDHDALVYQENWCLSIYNQFKGKAARYFATAAQQRKFKHACDQLKTYDDVLVELANNRVNESFRLLGMDPPAFGAAATTIADADEFAATGHEGWDKWLAALRGAQ